MRNLLGRLHARPAADLGRIAAFWRVPLGGAPGPAQVGALYRAMVDPRAARAVWDRLDPDERAMTRLLALADGPDALLELTELAARLGMTEAAARDVAIRLYRAGLLAREGDDEPLPVGAAPRLFLPRELALLFRRIQDEIDVGDRSRDRLETLLEWLDDAELEAAAARWGAPVVPGLRQRADLKRRLLRPLADPERIAAMAAGLPADAARIWRRMLAEPEGAPLPVAEVAAAVGLEGDDAPSARRLRAALDALEESLLVWHTYRADGSRWLFVPSDIRSPRGPDPAPLPPLEPLADDLVVPERWRHPDALAWDLLTVARTLSVPGGPAWPPSGEPPRSALRDLAGRLWFAPEGSPPAGYVGFLVALGRAAGVLVSREDGPPRLGLAPTFRAWRERPFAELTADLRARWEASATWSEGVGSGRIEVRGVDWAGARRRLLAALAEPAVGLEPGVWHALDGVAERVAAADPDLLGATFAAATASTAGEAGAGADEEEARRAAIADVVAIELAGALRWFGVVETGVVPGKSAAVRRPPTATPPTVDAGASSPGAPLSITADGEIALAAPSPVRVWALLTFADPIAFEPVC